LLEEGLGVVSPKSLSSIFSVFPERLSELELIPEPADPVVPLPPKIELIIFTIIFLTEIKLLFKKLNFYLRNYIH
jgi:hypothetical protein